MKIKLVIATACIMALGSFITNVASADSRRNTNRFSRAGARNFERLTRNRVSRTRGKVGSVMRAGPASTNRKLNLHRKITGTNTGKLFSRKVETPRSRLALDTGSKTRVVSRTQKATTPGNSDALASAIDQPAWNPTNQSMPPAAPSVDQALAEIEFENSQKQPRARQTGNQNTQLEPAPPLGEWEAYVARISELYEFTGAQRAMAQSILNNLQDRARLYQLRRGPEFDVVGKIQDRKVREVRLNQLNKPINLLFQELKLRLENLPTSPQKYRAKNKQSTRN